MVAAVAPLAGVGCVQIAVSLGLWTFRAVTLTTRHVGVRSGQCPSGLSMVKRPLI